MAPLPLTILSFSSEHPQYPASNLADKRERKNGRGWRCKDKGEKRAWLLIKLPELTTINFIDIGNAGSAFIEIEVGRTGMRTEEFRVLLPGSTFMSNIESRNSSNLKRVRMFNKENFAKNFSSEKWDLMKITCSQPFNERERYGLSFINVISDHTIPRRKNGEPDTEKNFGRFEIKPKVQGERIGQLGGTGPSGERDTQVPISEASHLLDVSETGSEALSMDVLADLDLQDSVSVARSDDTRFTDDSTISDPSDNIQCEDLTDYGGGTLTRGAVVRDVPRNADSLDSDDPTGVPQYQVLEEDPEHTARSARLHRDTHEAPSTARPQRSTPEINVGTSPLKTRGGTILRIPEPVMPSSDRNLLMAQYAPKAAVDPRFSTHRCPALLGMTVSVSQLNKADKELLRKSIETHGGSYSGVLEMDKTTVLVCASPAGDKYSHAKKWNIPALTSDWVFDSIDKGYCLGYDGYRVERHKDRASTPTKDNSRGASLAEVSMCSTIMDPNETNIVTKVNDTVNSTVLGPSLSSVLRGKTTAQWMADLDLVRVKKAGNFLDGCKIYLSGFTDHDQEQLRRVLKYAGATRLTQLVESVTHVVHAISTAVSSDTSRLISDLDMSPHNVAIEWLVESMKRGKPVPESDYLFPPPTDTAQNNFLPPPAVQEQDAETQAFEANLLAQYAPKVAAKVDETADATSCTVDGTATMSQVQQFLTGLTLELVGFNEETQSYLTDWVTEAGGELVYTDYKGELDYLVTPCTGGNSRHRFKKHVSSIWLEDCLDQGELLDIAYFHKIIHIDKDLKPLEGVVTGLSGYTGREREFLNSLVESLGGLPQKIFSKRDSKDKGLRGTTHLVCPEGVGQKYTAALKLKLPVINCDWLVACLREKQWVSESPFLVGDSTAFTPGKPMPVEAVVESSTKHLGAGKKSKSGNELQAVIGGAATHTQAKPAASKKTANISQANSGSMLEKVPKLSKTKGPKGGVQVPFKCLVCLKVLSTAVSLTRHKRLHTGEKPYQCQVCSKMFARSFTLAQHEKVHTGEKPNQCPHCQKSFSQKIHLVKHIRIHTGEKPYQCPHCQKSFSQKIHLVTHITVHTGEKTYQCTLCRKSFSDKSTLNRHHRNKKKCSK